MLDVLNGKEVALDFVEGKGYYAKYYAKVTEMQRMRIFLMPLVVCSKSGQLMTIESDNSVSPELVRLSVDPDGVTYFIWKMRGQYVKVRADYTSKQKCKPSKKPDYLPYVFAGN